MPNRPALLSVIAGFLLAVSFAAAQSPAQPTVPPGYDVAYIGTPMADPVLQHAKETYVLYGCSYCHGLYLYTRGEATDLMHSKLVARDQNGNLIKPLLRTGIPQTAKLSPMPQFSDLSDAQLGDLARWIHYARQQGRYKELMEAKESGAGDASAGKTYFEQNCASCHSSAGDLARKATTKAELLRPKFAAASASLNLSHREDIKITTARHRHLSLLENYSADDVANLTAYLKSLK
jgi:mono/diheme cytochrome c family protein